MLIVKVCRIVVSVVHGVPGVDTFVMLLVTVIVMANVVVFVKIHVVALALTDAGQNVEVTAPAVVLVPPIQEKVTLELYPE